jgi:hypothetical protein
MSRMKSGKKAKTLKKVPAQTEGYTPKGAMRGGGSTTRSAKAREKRLSKVAM